jgi:ribosomal-protein-alanine N-acetyltransferase
MPTGYQIETDRCRLHPLAVADAAPLHALWTRPRVRRFLWDDQIIPEAQTVDMLRTSGRLFEARGFGIWGVTTREHGTRQEHTPLAGFAGYWPFWTPPIDELVMGIAPEHWGRGIATEVGAALIRFAFETVGMSAVHASTDAPHRASVRVMEKLNMAFARRATVDGLDTLFYTLPLARWQADDAPYRLKQIDRPTPPL